jgi:2-polyprenyl-6-methoxyphenol hydroxylase-like FAD-dependent oxidoreductase
MAIKNIVIVGAGIGGLTAAIAARRAGIAVSIFEQASQLRPQGASVTLWPNALRCLRTLGVADEVVARGAVVRATEIRSLKGKVLAHIPMQSLYDEVGDIGICVTRADLQRVLIDALGGDGVHLNAEFQSFEQHADHVAIQFKDRDEICADLLIGADGLWSVVRQQLFADGQPDYAGYGAWLGLTTVDHPDLKREFGCEIYGAGERFGIFDTGQQQFYWYFVENRERPYAKVALGEPSRLFGKLRKWPDFARALVEGTEGSAIQYASFFDRPARRAWGEGRVMLLGDAIHPYVPNLGQGACQAIEDAYVLGHELKRSLTAADLLRRYQSARAERAATMGRVSARMGRFAQARNPLIRCLRDSIIHWTPTPLHLKQFRAHFALPDVL